MVSHMSGGTHASDPAEKRCRFCGGRGKRHARGCRRLVRKAERKPLPPSTWFRALCNQPMDAQFVANVLRDFTTEYQRPQIVFRHHGGDVIEFRIQEGGNSK